MGLLPLEFIDCLTDSPYFRENLHAHEKELDRTSLAIKNLIRGIKEVINAATNLSKAQRNLANSLQTFQMESIGSSQTDDEIVIGDALNEIGCYISKVEEERDRMLKMAHKQFLSPLEEFRKKHIGAAKDGKKKFDKQTSKFCQSQERYLNLSTKKQDNQLKEADSSLEMEKICFHKASMDYVIRLQEVQERKKFEFVETLLRYMYSWLTFYHHGHEIAKDFRPYMMDIQEKLQKAQENFNAAHVEAESLMNKMLEKMSDVGSIDKKYTRQGYLFLMEKKALGTTWTKHYCQYIKENRNFVMMPYSQTTGKSTGIDSIKLKSCVRRMSDSIDKRFCFDVTAEDRPGIYTFQALSEKDRQLWMNAMDGKEPMYSQPSGRSPKLEEGHLDEVGFAFVQTCIAALEERGLEEQGLYRLVGVTSKVTKLLQMGLDKRKQERLNLDDAVDWECKTITSALKTFFRNLPEPVMTFRLHSAFISAAKRDSLEARMNDIHALTHHLPRPNFDMLKILIQHLCNVSAKSSKNLMTVSNLGVCFGPTLLRPEEETVTAIMEIKFGNIVVEILIENFIQIFNQIPKNDDVVRRLLAQAPPPSLALSARAPHAIATSHALLSVGMGLGGYDDSILGSLGGKSISSPGLELLSSSIPSSAQQPRPMLTPFPFSVYNPLANNNCASNNSSSCESVNSSSYQPKIRDLNHFPSGHSLNPVEKVSTLKTNSKSRLPEQRYGSIGRQTSKDKITNSSALTHQASNSSLNISSSSPNSGSRQVRTLYHCVAENETELSFEPNQIINNVRPSKEPGWLEGCLKGKCGLIPENYVEYLP